MFIKRVRRFVLFGEKAYHELAFPGPFWRQGQGGVPRMQDEDYAVAELALYKYDGMRCCEIMSPEQTSGDVRRSAQTLHTRYETICGPAQEHVELPKCTH